MTEVAVPPRSAIAPEHTWNAESVYATETNWAADAERVASAIEALQAYQGRLTEGSATLLAALDAMEALLRLVEKVYTYAGMAYYVETTNQDATRSFARAQGLLGQALAAVGFVDPELLAIGRPTLDAWLRADPRLAVYGQHVDDLFRRQAHVRSAEVEQLLGALSDPFGSTRQTASMLTDADFKFHPARTSIGREIELTHGNNDAIRGDPDRELRRTAYESFTDTFLAFQNTLANNLSTSIKQNVFRSRARQYPSSLEASLFANNIPTAVFHNLIETFRRNLPTWHRYWAVRRKALGVAPLRPYDIWAPLASRGPRVTYRQAVDWIAAGLAPLGDDYVRVLRRGTLDERWVDIYPSQGKSEGAFSSGSPGTHPFILMSFEDSLSSLSTLAHELGHSMHSYLTWQNQPYVYGNYSLFVAEVASNFNQAMVRGYLLGRQPERDFKIAIIEEAMANFHRYFFIMPSLARFELETHQRVEQGQGLTAPDMNALMADLLAEGYGSELEIDREREGITWATFGHLYADYYVYQYATGISAANALARRILAGSPGAADAYLKFLKSGSSLYPLDALKLAGVDMTQAGPVEEAFAALHDLVSQLEQLFP